jgi:hypothetical protein
MGDIEMATAEERRTIVSANAPEIVALAEDMDELIATFREKHAAIAALEDANRRAMGSSAMGISGRERLAHYAHSKMIAPENGIDPPERPSVADLARQAWSNYL